MSIENNPGTDNKKGPMETRYHYDAKEVFQKLNKVSPSFCLAKWFNVSIHIPTGQTHSCYHPKSHHIPLNEIKIDTSALHNTKYKKEQRKLMLDGERPPECEFCWEIEDSGKELSDRAYRSTDIYIYEDHILEHAIELGHEGNANPRYVEVNFNQACNFKCSYCSPHLSTAWMQDIEKNGPYQLGEFKHNDITWMKNSNMIPNNGPDNPYLLAFWDWFPKIYPTLKTFRMTGGEPLMDKNTFRVFDYVKNNPKKNLHLSITSNCCPPGNQWEKFMHSLKEITDSEFVEEFFLYCSLDSWGKQAEYIRNGLNFDTLFKNVNDYLQNGSNHRLTFIITFNVLSYSGLFQYMEQILALKQKYNINKQVITFDVPQLQYPAWLNPKIMPEGVKELQRVVDFMEKHKQNDSKLVSNPFKGFVDIEINKVKRLIDWINGPTDFKKSDAMAKFYLFVTEYDRRNGTVFSDYFPELKDFLKQCRKCSINTNT